LVSQKQRQFSDGVRAGDYAAGSPNQYLVFVGSIPRVISCYAQPAVKFSVHFIMKQKCSINFDVTLRLDQYGPCAGNIRWKNAVLHSAMLSSALFICIFFVK
jgi:hypothetical protein